MYTFLYTYMQIYLKTNQVKISIYILLRIFCCNTYWILPNAFFYIYPDDQSFFPHLTYWYNTSHEKIF